MPASSRGIAAVLSSGGLIALGAFGACQGAEFTGATEQGESGQAGRPAEVVGGAPSHVGGQPTSAGALNQGGEAEGVGGAGEGGMPSGACSSNADCRAGTFCQQGSCVSCSELSDLATLEYGNPEPLEVINATAGIEGMRFPRPTGQGLGLIYVRDFFGGHLWFTSDPTVSAGMALPAPEEGFESAGLRVSFPLPPELAAYNFFFQRSLPSGEVTLATLYGAKMDKDGNVTGVAALPAPFNQANVTASYAIALAEHRAVWTQNLDGGLQIKLKTVKLPSSGQEPEDLLLPLPFDCGSANELEYAPWLTPDGKVLLFRARAANASCMFTADTPTRIYVVGLSELGKPLGPARALTGLGPEQSKQTDPAMSPDRCHLFFSTQNEAGIGLYRAERLH